MILLNTNARLFDTRELRVNSIESPNVPITLFTNTFFVSLTLIIKCMPFLITGLVVYSDPKYKIIFVTYIDSSDSILGDTVINNFSPLIKISALWSSVSS